MTKPSLKPGWQWVKFGDVVRQVKDKVDPWESGLKRYVAGEHMNTDDLRIRQWGTIGDDYLGPAFHMRFKPGQVLYGSRRTYLRKVAVPDFEGICANTTFVLEPKDPKVLLPELLPFIMQTEAFHDHSVKQSKGSVNPYVNFSDLAWWEFALPPLEEQKECAALLWASEDCHERYLVAQDQLRIARRAFLERLFGQYIGPTASLQQVAEIASGGTPTKSNRSYWGGHIPWLSPKDMKTPLISDTEDTITEEAVRAGARVVPEGSIFIVVRGMILAHSFPVCRALKPMAFNQDVKALVISSSYLSEYVHAWFDWAAPRYLQLVSESSHGTKRLETSQLLRLQVPILSLQQQKDVVEQLARFGRAISRLEVKLAQQLSLKRAILKDLGALHV